MVPIFTPTPPPVMKRPMWLPSQTLPNVPWGTKASPVENHCSKVVKFIKSSPLTQKIQSGYPSLTTLNEKGISRPGIRSMCNSIISVLKNQKTVVKAVTVSTGHTPGLNWHRSLNT